MHLNPAQRLLQSFFDTPRRPHKPKLPNMRLVVGDTDDPHVDKFTGRVLHRRPIFLKRAVLVDGSKRYPYSSNRQTAGGRRASFAPEALAA